MPVRNSPNEGNLRRKLKGRGLGSSGIGPQGPIGPEGPQGPAGNNTQFTTVQNLPSLPISGYTPSDNVLIQTLPSLP